MAGPRKTTILSSLLVFVGVASGFAGGLWYAGRHVVYGRVDPVITHVGQRVMLNSELRFEDGHGQPMSLAPGTRLVWEGSQGIQHYLAIRFVVNRGDVFEITDDRPSYDFVQVAE